jgi:MFS family permease
LNRRGKVGRGTFRSLSNNRNFRLYYFGQMVSQAGTFMQTVALAWLVYQLTGSGTALGLIPLLQFGPLLVFAGWAGVLVDRCDRRKLYITTQALAGAEATVLGILVVTGSVQLWMVYALALVLGFITVIDQPTKNTFIYDMVGPSDLTNAVSLTMTIGSASRALGPAIAGLLIASVGVGTCFLVNAASYLVVIACLVVMRPAELLPAKPAPRERGQFREGVRYVRGHRELLAILIFIAMFLGLAWEFEVALPLLANRTFGGGAGLYGLMSSVLGIGALTGGMLMARYGQANKRTVMTGGVSVTIALFLAAFAPHIWVEMIALALVGVTSCIAAASSSATAQLLAAPEMRGRVMGLYTMGSIGTRPIGGFIVGYVGQHVGPRASFVFSGCSVAVALVLWHVIGRTRPRPVSVAPQSRSDALGNELAVS